MMKMTQNENWRTLMMMVLILTYWHVMKTDDSCWKYFYGLE